MILTVTAIEFFTPYTTGVMISPQPNQEGNKIRSMLGTRAILTISRREFLPIFFLQGKVPEEIHIFLPERLVCSIRGRAKDLLTSLYFSENISAPFRNTLSISNLNVLVILIGSINIRFCTNPLNIMLLSNFDILTVYDTQFFS